MLDKNATFYRVSNLPGVAVWFKGYTVKWVEVEGYDDDFNIIELDQEPVTDYDNAIVVMVGDDREHIVDVEDLIPINEDEFCSSCGQIGCGHG